MGRQAVKTVHTADIKIEQQPPLSEADMKDRKPEIVVADKPINKEYMDELAFMEEPVTIRIEPSSERNAATAHYCAVNGKGCEVWNEITKSWVEMDYIPVSTDLVIKRKYAAVLAGAKSTQINTQHQDAGSEFIDNRVVRITSAVATMSIIGDSAKGHAFFTEIRRRNF